jgi:hypothetical protein
MATLSRKRERGYLMPVKAPLPVAEEGGAYAEGVGG